MMGLTERAWAQPINWQVHTINPQQYWASGDTIKYAEEVGQLTNGRLKLTVYPSGALGFTGPDMLDTISKNLVQMGEVWGSHVAGQEQIMELFELPLFVPWDFNLMTRLWDELHDDYAKLLKARYNVRLLTIIQNEPRMLHTKRKVTTLADLKGLKIRAVGPVESTFTKNIGAVPVPVNWGELYTALSTGVVDGNWAADLAEFSMKFYESVKYTFDTHTAGIGFFIIASEDAIAGLPPDVRQTFLESVSRHRDRLRASMLNGTNLGRKLMVEKGQMQVVPVPDADRATMKRAAEPIISAWVTRLDPESRRIYEKAKAIIERN
ncbi:MAG: TRAP transporter substrate-binding protein DctP [Candidatus Lambdaproteobacteria bacterium]|nr:TRAP transporter substrate-binding protein DctP [Candidatus Lambdaproteobacteria bacterium]